jgi:acyl-CoA oxidase
MMYVREIIMGMAPIALAASLIIATRYSFFRKQGMGADKKEMNILGYQTQQEKILPRIAEYYALTVAGVTIGKQSQSNR